MTSSGDRRSWRDLFPGGGDRADPGRHRVVPDIEPRSFGAGPCVVRRLMADAGDTVLSGQQRELVLPGLHRGAARRDGAGAAVVLPRRLGQDHPRLPAQPARERPAERAGTAAAAVGAGQGRAARVDDHLRDDPGRADRRLARAHIPDGVRQAAGRGGPAVRQRADPARRRGAAPVRRPAEAGAPGRDGRPAQAYVPRPAPQEPGYPAAPGYDLPRRSRGTPVPPTRRTRTAGEQQDRTAPRPAGGPLPTSPRRNSPTSGSRGCPTRTPS